MLSQMTSIECIKRQCFVVQISGGKILPSRQKSLLIMEMTPRQEIVTQGQGRIFPAVKTQFFMTQP